MAAWGKDREADGKVRLLQWNMGKASCVFIEGVGR